MTRNANRTKPRTSRAALPPEDQLPSVTYKFAACVVTQAENASARQLGGSLPQNMPDL